MQAKDEDAKQRDNQQEPYYGHEYAAADVLAMILEMVILPNYAERLH